MGIDVEALKDKGPWGPDCYCGSRTRLRNGPHGPFYSCVRWPECDGAVGCHPDTTDPLGAPADKETRQARRLAHAVFDPIWESEEGPSRGGAYAWLAYRLDVEPEECHIGEFDLDQCKRVVANCSGVEPREVKAWLDKVDELFGEVKASHLRELRKDMRL